MNTPQTPPAGDFGSTDGLGGLVERLRLRHVTRWVHSTGETPRADGYSVDSDCSEAADAIERLMELAQERRELIAERECVLVEKAKLHDALDALLEVAEKVVDTRTCSVGILRAMNEARKSLKPNVAIKPPVLRSA